LVRAQAALQAASRTDALTGVGNRRMLESLSQTLSLRTRSGGTDLAVLLVDVDLFKAFNEAVGHLRGDDCLRSVARVLQSAISPNRDVLLRSGGEEFLVVLPDSDPDAARRCASRIHSLLRAEALSHPASEVSERVTVSIGVAVATVAHRLDIDLLISTASEALGEAKGTGRNRTVFRLLDQRAAMSHGVGPLRIGLLAPFSGVVSMYGEEIQRAAQLAVQLVNEDGGVKGRPLELVVLDDGSQPEPAVRAAREMVESHGCVALIGTLLSNSRIAVVDRIAGPNRVPLLNYSFNEGGIDNPWFFNFAAVPNQQIESLVPYLMSRFGARFYFAGNNYEWPRGSIDAAKRTLTARGGEVVGEEYLQFAPTEAQIDDLISDVATSGAQVFVPYFAGLDQVSVLRAAHAAGLRESMGIGMGHFDPVLAGLMTPAERAGLIVANTYFMSVDTPENGELLRRLEDSPGVTGLWPEGNGLVTNFGEGAWVCVLAFAEAARTSADFSAAAMAEALSQVSVQVPQGVVTMDPGTHHAAVSCYIAEAQASGDFAVVARSGAAPARVPERFLVGSSTWSSPEYVGDDPRNESRNTAGAVIIADCRAVIRTANRAAGVLFGYPHEELPGMNLSALIPPHLRQTYTGEYADFLASADSERVITEDSSLCGYRRDGTFFNLGGVANKQVINDQLLVVVALADLEDLVSAHRVRRRLITHDPLTGLINREVFLQRLDGALQRAARDGQRVLVASIDIDGLGAVNRRFGTAVGDELLATLGQRLSRSVAGAVVSRVSDDRFAIFTEAPASPEALATVVAEIAEAVNTHVEAGEASLVASSTLGVAEGTPEVTAELLLTHAEAAMYDAKTTNRGGWRFYHPNQQHLAERTLAIDSLLRDPLLESQFELFFQPIFSLSIDGMIGAEALLRWNSPIGPIGPAEFIPIAEGNGAILRIGRWVVEQGLQTLVEFHRLYGRQSPMLSINISPQHLTATVRQFDQLLRELDINPSEVLLEITETGLDTADASANADLAALKALGLGVAIDDFGTGTSGLAMVGQLNVDTLKIDRGFVDGAFALPRRRKLLGAIVSMAHALGLSVIAEGVEDPRDLEFLKSVGCDAVQGYLLARPMQAQQFFAAWAESLELA
jgi:diguanylate cyclase (GGDEF)-like protein/PAS domain S-box-containing protein